MPPTPSNPCLHVSFFLFHPFQFAYPFTSLLLYLLSPLTGLLRIPSISPNPYLMWRSAVLSAYEMLGQTPPPSFYSWSVEALLSRQANITSKAQLLRRIVRLDAQLGRRGVAGEGGGEGRGGMSWASGCRSRLSV